MGGDGSGRFGRLETGEFNGGNRYACDPELEKNAKAGRKPSGVFPTRAPNTLTSWDRDDMGDKAG